MVAVLEKTGTLNQRDARVEAVSIDAMQPRTSLTLEIPTIAMQ